MSILPNKEGRELSLAEKQLAAERILGVNGWGKDTKGRPCGFFDCPGKADHSTPTKRDHTRVYVEEGTPSVDCSHTSCTGLIKGLNSQLRSYLGKLAWEPIESAGGVVPNIQATPRPQKASSTEGPKEKRAFAPLPVPVPLADPTSSFLRAMFQPGEFVAFSNLSLVNGRLAPVSQETIERDAFIEKITTAGGIKAMFPNSPGMYVRVNPVIKGGSGDHEVTAYRHVLVEIDADENGATVPREAQFGAIVASGLPVTVVTFSAGKSLHALVRVDAANFEQHKERGAVVLARFRQFLPPDEKCFNPSRYSRMPGAQRLVSALADERKVYSEQELLAVGLGPGTWKEYVALHPYKSASGDDWPEFVDAKAMLENPPEAPQPLIEGVLNRGEMMLIGAEAKLGKTWMAIQAGLCVATGTPWLGFPTVKEKVLFINLELTPHAFYTRLKWMARELGVALQPGDFTVWNLRGHNAEMKTLVDKILARPPEAVGLIIPDPVYKTLGNREENKAEDVADLLGHLDRLGRHSGAAVLLTHHFAKGAASSKENIDQFSGSGVWVRHPDVLANVKRLKEDSAFVLSMTVRNSKSPPDMGLRLEFPLMVPDDALDVTRINGTPDPRVKSGVPELEAVLSRFPTEFDESNPRSAVLSNGQVENAIVKAGHSKSSWKGIRDELLSCGELAVITGLPRNEKLYGLPEIVQRYNATLQNPPLIANRKKRKIRR